jgi:hypothetical protein
MISGPRQGTSNVAEEPATHLGRNSILKRTSWEAGYDLSLETQASTCRGKEERVRCRWKTRPGLR